MISHCARGAYKPFKRNRELGNYGEPENLRLTCSNPAEPELSRLGRRCSADSGSDRFELEVRFENLLVVDAVAASAVHGKCCIERREGLLVEPTGLLCRGHHRSCLEHLQSSVG